MTDKIVVLSTCSSEEEARRIARVLVEARLAACVNVLPAARSVYRWKGVVEEASEVMIAIKSSRGLFQELSDKLKKLHSYEVPEIIAIPMVAASEEYLEWMEKEIGGGERE